MPLTADAFHRLVNDHAPALYRLAFRLLGDRHEAEDIVQETFRSAWKSRDLFRPGASDRAWLAAILRRRAVDAWRRPSRPCLSADGTTPDIGQPAEDPTRNQYSDQMQRALEQLPTELRETLLLVVVAELTHQETADLLDIPLGTVLSRVSRARRRMRELLLTSNGPVGRVD